MLCNQNNNNLWLYIKSLLYHLCFQNLSYMKWTICVVKNGRTVRTTYVCTCKKLYHLLRRFLKRRNKEMMHGRNNVLLYFVIPFSKDWKILNDYDLEFHHHHRSRRQHDFIFMLFCCLWWGKSLFIVFTFHIGIGIRKLSNVLI